MPAIDRRSALGTLAALGATLLLSACASLNHLASDVVSYGQWPPERKPGPYTFERLPSQQTQAELQQRLEDAARPALQAAGFTPAADAATADFVVLLGARVTGTEAYYWDDPFWWRGSLVYGRRGVWLRSPWWGAFPPTPIYEREVAVLIRDRRTGQALYEARASNDGGSPSIYSLLPAMFEAALKDFPATGPNPRRIVTPISPKP